MPLVNQISALATRMGTECKSIRGTIGSLNSLTTTEKGTLVGAINEVKAAAGVGGNITTESITDATTLGRNVLKAVDQAAVRTLIGAGTSNLALGTTSTTAKAGNYQPTAANISDSTTVGRAVLVATDQAAARTAIGAVDAAAIDTRITAVVGAAPAALDTLAELAAALGGDANFASTVTTGLSNRVRVDASQTLTAAQQLQARTNIGAVAAADIGNTETDFVSVFNAALL